MVPQSALLVTDRQRRVVLVDDNSFTLAGYADALRSHPAITLVAAIDHRTALDESMEWVGIDVVLLDAADESRAGDQFPGVRVVRHIRSVEDPTRSTIIVVTGHFFDDGLRRRMAEADADFFFLRPEIRSSDKLFDIVLNSDCYRRGVPPVVDEDSQALLGIDRHSRLDAFIDYVERHDLEGVLDGPEMGTPSRRSLLRHRSGLSRVSRIHPINISTGFPPGQDQTSPSLRQLRKIWAWAARSKYPNDDKTARNYGDDES